MWVARDKNGELGFFTWKPVRYNDFWGESDFGPSISDSCSLPKRMFPNLTWEDGPIEVDLIELNTINKEPIDDTIVLTRYYEDYEKEHKWFVNMLKHQEHYKDCTDEEIEEIWKDNIKEKYTFDEIWSTIQCDGYTKVVLRMGRHDNQPEYDYVCESKEYIDTKMKRNL